MRISDSEPRFYVDTFACERGAALVVDRHTNFCFGPFTLERAEHWIARLTRAHVNRQRKLLCKS